MMKYLFMSIIIFSPIFSMHKKEIKETTRILTKVVINNDQSSSDLDDGLHCSLCFEYYNKESKKRVAILCDTHRNIYHCYCKQCITDWVKKNESCPTCKRSIKLQDIPDFDYFSTIIAYLQKLCCCE